MSEEEVVISDVESEPQSRVTRISIGRVHNLGNYENIRYEVTVEVAPGENVSELISKLETAVEDIRANSNNSSYDVKRSQELLSKPVTELSEFDIERLGYHKKVIAEHEEDLAKRQQAKMFLNNIGVSSQYKDAKTEWEDDDGY